MSLPAISLCPKGFDTMEMSVPVNRKDMIMKKIVYYISYTLWFLFSLLPLRVWYVISDLLYYPVYYLVGYRRKVVRKNLTESFPEKSEKEIVRIEKDFYRYFCDYCVETIKYFSIKRKTIEKRMVFEGVDEINKCVEKGKSCILYMGHYCNWEWVSSLPLYVADREDLVKGHIYHKLENDNADKLFFGMRQRFNSENIEMFAALRYLVKCRRENKKFVIGFISDQSPNWNSMGMWTEFLNHKTSFFVGAEGLAKMSDAAVFYMDIRRERRGYYKARFIKITEDPKSYGEYELTAMYARMLEDTIKREPQYWLWSHNRWKRTYEEYIYRKENKLL